MEDKNVLLEAEGYTKQKRDEVVLWRRKRRKEDDIRTTNMYICPQRLGGHKIRFYSEDWNEVQQEEDEW